MRPSTVLFVGLGGAGQRHARILRRHLPDARFLAYRRTRATPLLNADFTAVAGSPEDAYRLAVVPTLEDGLRRQPDLVVISTPSSLHYDAMMAAAERGASVLVEKPWSHDLAGFRRFQEVLARAGGSFRISFQRRHHALLKHLHGLVASGALGRVVHARMAVGSFVPAWHPYEDWRQLYAVRKDLGGGVLLTECHEFDLCHWFFGLPQRISCTGGNYGPEALDVEDTAHVTLDYGRFSVQVALCFMQREPRRTIDIAGTDGYARWDAAGNRLMHVDYKTGRREEIADPGFANDDMFETQTADLLADRAGATDAHLRSAWAAQAMIEAAKLSMRANRMVALPAYPSEVIA